MAPLTGLLYLCDFQSAISFSKSLLLPVAPLTSHGQCCKTIITMRDHYTHPTPLPTPLFQERVLTCSHELLEVAGWEGVVLWAHQVQVVPVGQLNVGAQLDRIILLFIRQVDQKPTAHTLCIHKQAIVFLNKGDIETNTERLLANHERVICIHSRSLCLLDLATWNVRS